MSMHKGGRPTKKQKETVDKVIAGITDGLPIKSACAAAKISDDTLRNWMRDDEALALRVEEARAKIEYQLVSVIRVAATPRKVVTERKTKEGIVTRTTVEPGDWKAAAFILERQFKKDWTPTLEVTQKETPALPIDPSLLTAEELDQLEAIHEAAETRAAEGLIPRPSQSGEGEATA